MVGMTPHKVPTKRAIRDVAMALILGERLCYCPAGRGRGSALGGSMLFSRM